MCASVWTNNEMDRSRLQPPFISPPALLRRVARSSTLSEIYFRTRRGRSSCRCSTSSLELLCRFSMFICGENRFVAQRTIIRRLATNPRVHARNGSAALSIDAQELFLPLLHGSGGPDHGNFFFPSLSLSPLFLHPSLSLSLSIRSLNSLHLYSLSLSFYLLTLLKPFQKASPTFVYICEKFCLALRPYHENILYLHSHRPPPSPYICGWSSLMV